MWIRSLALLVGLAAGSAAAQVATDADSLLDYTMEPVVVTGTRIEVARSNVPLTVSTIRGETLRNSGETNVLPELSRRVPGVFVTERGTVGFGISGGSAGHIRVRGVGGSPNTNVLVMVDGHPQFMGIFGHPFPDAYVTSDADRVEVIRGPASILYGTGAMGGVVNIITSRSTRDGFRASASAAYGSHATQHYSAGGGYRMKGQEAFLSLNHDRTDGHRDALDEFDLTNLYLKLRSRISSRWHVTVDGRLTQFHTEDPGPISDPNAAAAEDADVLRTRVGLSLENRHDRSQGAIKAYYNYGEHDIFDGFESEDFNTGIVAYQAYRVVPQLVATVGVDAKRYGGSARNVLGGADFGDHHVSEVGGYGFLQYAPRSRFMLSGGVRLESNSEFGTELVPQVGAVVHAGARTTLRGSVAKGFRSPTILELYLFGIGNPDLEPERMWNYELAVAHRIGPLQAELVGFVIDGSNLIEVRGGPTGPMRRNVGEFTNRGLEFQLSWSVSPSLAANGNLSYLNAGTPVIGAPEWMGFGELVYSRRAVTVGIEAQFVSGLLLAPGAEDVPAMETDFALIHARASYRPVAFGEVFVRLENLLDESYEINIGYPMPGTTIMTGVRLRY